MFNIKNLDITLEYPHKPLYDNEEFIYMLSDPVSGLRKNLDP
jgi:hypothetical protein